MKKSFFTLSLLLASFGSASAQVELSGSFRSGIPAEFTFEHTPYVLTEDWKGNSTYEYKIYDFALNEVASFIVENRHQFEFEHFLNEDGYSFDERSRIYLTQCLFNDDADWEYVEEVKEEVEDDPYPFGRIRELLFKKTDGTIIGRLDYNKYGYIHLIRIGKVSYFFTEEYQEDGSYVTKYYTIPQFRRLIAGEDPSRINAKVMDQKAATFDLSGRKVGSDYHGVVVKGNVKKIQ